MRLNSNALAQIAVEKPGETDLLIHKMGYELPENPSDRIAALEQLIELEGDRAEEELVALLPQAEPQESCYCGSCGKLAYTGEMESAAPEKETPEQLPVDWEWLEEQFAKVHKRNIAAVGFLAVFVLVVSAIYWNG